MAPTLAMPWRQSAVPRPLPPFALSHHSDTDTQRCLRVRGLWLCRRCAVITAALVPAQLFLAVRTIGPSLALDLALLALCLPAAVEYALVAHTRLPYRASRVLALNAPVGMLLALATTRLQRGHGLFLATAALTMGGGLTLANLAVRGRRKGNP